MKINWDLTKKLRLCFAVVSLVLGVGLLVFEINDFGLNPLIF